jgi:hypothetical protein
VYDGVVPESKKRNLGSGCLRYGSETKFEVGCGPVFEIFLLEAP